MRCYRISDRRLHIALAICVFLAAANRASADGLYDLFLPASPTSTNIHTVGVQVKYEVYAAGIGKLTGVSTWKDASGVYAPGTLDGTSTVTNEFYLVEAYFNLADGTIRMNDASYQNRLLLSGNLQGNRPDLGLVAGQQTFFDSKTLAQFGYSSTQGIFDFRFFGNNGTLKHDPSIPGTPVSSRILAVSTTPSQVNFKYTGTAGVGTVLWSNNSNGSANTWAPIPGSAYAGATLLSLMAVGMLVQSKRGIQKR